MYCRSGALAFSGNILQLFPLNIPPLKLDLEHLQQVNVSLHL